MNTLRKFLLAASAFGLIVALERGWHASVYWRHAAVAAIFCGALGSGAISRLKSYQFTLWIVAVVAAAMIYPAAFVNWGGFDLRTKWFVVLVVQLVMFGMGTQMSLRDFGGVVKNPRGVFVGILCHFSVMPLVGFGLTKIFHFEPQIAAGIILIGSCSSGLASNVMAYIAKSNLALSVTVTAITTLVAPFLTPLWMKLLAGTLVEVRFVAMMVDIIKLVIVPIGAAMLHEYLKEASPGGKRNVHLASVACAIWIALAISPLSPVRNLEPSANIVLFFNLSVYLCGAVMFGNLYHQLTRVLPTLDRWMPVVSMAGIVYYTTVTTAAGRDSLLKIGALLFVAAVLHNAAGYFLGYWLSRATGLDKNSARSVAFEVGLQNGGMATGIANNMGKMATVGLAAAIFSPWMNISGSLLANYWRRRPEPVVNSTSG